MAHWQVGNKTVAADWYSKAIEWMENSSINWPSAQGQMIYDIYLEATELIGIETREF